MHQKFDVMCEKLHEKAYKITPQRTIILRAFIDQGEGHLSAEDVYNLVKTKNPDIGLATVYRTLELLADLEILQKMDFGDGRSRYEFSNQEVHHHHHLICLKCHRVSEFDDDLLETLEAVIARKSNFKVVDHDLKVYGLCKDCQTEA